MIKEIIDALTNIKLDIIRKCVSNLTKDSSIYCSQRVDNLFNHVVFGGKYERSQLLISTYKALDRDASSKRILEVTKVAACLEICQAFLLTIDDIMDDSIKRRGKNCWHTLPSIGLNACNDAILLDCIVHDVLNDALVQDCENFLEILFTVNLIYIIELHFRYRDIVNNKTSYYSFYSPIKIACLLADQPLVPSQWKSLAFKSGYLFQAQDDYIDCFGESIITGKIGSDLREGKCTWIICKALDQTVSRPDIRRTLTVCCDYIFFIIILKLIAIIKIFL
ncbi:unnamed protein product [Dracunculus medinensis]|uniref:Farnesyl pyrophosphate synthase n=1 Tax=Dracunculus medinensis TaxID=318479 RepID=A0A0N4U8I8_DRAME|nr:unnamed protein product [Dracunculus medinensis]